MHDRGIPCVFAKPPRPGEVKTRPARALGDEPAAALARAFFLDTWRSAASCTWARAVLVAIGTDAPGLPPRLLDAAHRALVTSDAAIAPCEDGGCYLIALRRCPPRLLADLPWSG